MASKSSWLLAATNVMVKPQFSEPLDLQIDRLLGCAARPHFDSGIIRCGQIMKTANLKY